MGQKIKLSSNWSYDTYTHRIHTKLMNEMMSAFYMTLTSRNRRLFYHFPFIWASCRHRRRRRRRCCCCYFFAVLLTNFEYVNGNLKSAIAQDATEHVCSPQWLLLLFLVESLSFHIIFVKVSHKILSNNSLSQKRTWKMFFETYNDPKCTHELTDIHMKWSLFSSPSSPSSTNGSLQLIRLLTHTPTIFIANRNEIINSNNNNNSKRQQPRQIQTATAKQTFSEVQLAF